MKDDNVYIEITSEKSHETSPPLYEAPKNNEINEYIMPKTPQHIHDPIINSPSAYRQSTYRDYLLLRHQHSLSNTVALEVQPDYKPNRNKRIIPLGFGLMLFVFLSVMVLVLGLGIAVVYLWFPEVFRGRFGFI